MKKIQNLVLNIGHTQEELIEKASKIANIEKQSIKTFRIVKRSLDARKKNELKFVYCVELSQELEPANEPSFPVLKKKIAKSPVIVGSGPCGLFCAYFLAKAGAKPIIIERGSCVEKRTQKVANFFENATLDTECNIQFGEGGAGTFSDGKLNTLTNSPLIQDVLSIFCKHGAPEEILFSNKPHIGTDILKTVVTSMRHEIEKLGGTFFFDTKFENFSTKDGHVLQVQTTNGTFDSDHLILAIGHSSRDTYEMLNSKNVAMTQKNFAVGVRIEHPKSFVDELQYGNKSLAKKLGSADYKLATHDKSGNGIFSFCMCPGGKVIASSSEEGMVVTNGMSLHARNDANSNSAILCSVGEKDFGGTGTFDGMNFQRKLERLAFEAGGKNFCAPIQLLGDFGTNRTSSPKNVAPTYPIGTQVFPLHKILGEKITQSMLEGFENFDKKMRGFKMPTAVLTAVETRTSAPLRILRNENYHSISVEGLMPVGEGCGYAGGITSASVDGINCALKLIEQLNA